MKIAVDVRDAFREKAGKGYYTIHIITHLFEIDKKNKYILYANQPVETISKDKNVEVKVIPEKGFKWHRAVLKDSYKEKIDIFFAPTSYIIPAIHDPEKISVAVTVHDLIAFLYPQKHNKKAVILERLLLKKALKKSALVLAVSKNTKNDICNRFPCNPRKIKIISNAASEIFHPMEDVDLTFFKEEKQIPDKFIFSAGTLEPRKNYEGLIKAFAKVRKQFPDYKLLIAGKKGWNYKSIFDTVENLNLSESVVFLDYVPERDLARLYNLATVFMYVSFYEGFGIPPLEAMQSGCPIIASNVSSIPEVVNNAAILIDPRNTREMAEAMKKILHSKKLRDDLREKGFKQAQKFSWKRNAQNLLDLFESI